MIYSNELENIDDKLRNQLGESEGATVSAWMCVSSFVHNSCLPLFAHCCHFGPTLHRIHPSVTSFTQTETYYWRLFCNKVRDVLHYDLCVVLGNLSSQCCPAGSLLFADFFFCWLACCSNSQCNTFLGRICFALMEAR